MGVPLPFICATSTQRSPQAPLYIVSYSHRQEWIATVLFWLTCQTRIRTWQGLNKFDAAWTLNAWSYELGNCTCITLRQVCTATPKKIEGLT